MSSDDTRPDPDLQVVSDPPIRRDLVERVRKEIAEGTYITPEKLRLAVARLVDAEAD